MAIQHSNLKRGSLIPADDFLILQPVYLSNITEAGIQTGMEEESLPFGIVVARGKNCSKYEINSYLLLSPMGGYTYALMKQNYIIAREVDIVAEVVFTEDEESESSPPKETSSSTQNLKGLN